jgi:cytidylate kinase
VVFPDADFKFYLDASPQCRAERRRRQLLQQGVSLSYEEILAAQQQRDQRDTSRQTGPLKAAPDATVVDTTHQTIDEVVDTLYRHIQERA